MYFVSRTATGCQRDSNPCFSLERVVTRLVNTGTYRTVATGGCHDAFKFEWFVSQAVQTLCPAAKGHVQPRILQELDAFAGPLLTLSRGRTGAGEPAFPHRAAGRPLSGGAMARFPLMRWLAKRRRRDGLLAGHTERATSPMRWMRRPRSLCRSRRRVSCRSLRRRSRLVVPAGS